MLPLRDILGSVAALSYDPGRSPSRRKPPPFPSHQWYEPNSRYHHYTGSERTFLRKDGGVNARVYYLVGHVLHSCSLRNWEQWVVGCTRLFPPT